MNYLMRKVIVLMMVQISIGVSDIQISEKKDTTVSREELMDL